MNPSVRPEPQPRPPSHCSTIHARIYQCPLTRQRPPQRNHPRPTSVATSGKDGDAISKTNLGPPLGITRKAPVCRALRHPRRHYHIGMDRLWVARRDAVREGVTRGLRQGLFHFEVGGLPECDCMRWYRLTRLFS